MAYEFSDAESVAESFARVSGEQVDQAVHALTEDLEADPTTAIHTARKAVKKQRALLRMARGSLPRPERRSANARLRAAAQRLSGFRDADVMIQTLDQLSERFVGQLPASTFAAFREQLERDLQSPAEDNRSAAIDAALTDLHAVRRAVAKWTLRGNGWTAIEPGLVRTYRDGRKAFRRAQKKPTLENRHTWRKRVKDGWYELRLLAPRCGPAVRGQAEEAERLAELLGVEHDLGILKDNLQRLAPRVAEDAEAMVGLIDFRRDELQTQAALIAERMYAESPTAFARRLRHYWRAGQAGNQALEDRRPAALAEATRTRGAG